MTQMCEMTIVVCLGDFCGLCSGSVWDRMPRDNYLLSRGFGGHNAFFFVKMAIRAWPIAVGDITSYFASSAVQASLGRLSSNLLHGGVGVAILCFDWSRRHVRFVGIPG